MTQTENWDAFRYVTDDSTLDRAAFESRMLDDPNLALEVADAVASVQSMQAALASKPVVQQPVVAPSHAQSHWSTIATPSRLMSAALAATLLLAIVYSSSSRDAQSGLKTASQTLPRHETDRTPELVENWVELVRLVAYEEPVDKSSDPGESESELMPVGDEATSDGDSDIAANDWMIDAASEYFDAGEAG